MLAHETRDSIGLICEIAKTSLKPAIFAVIDVATPESSSALLVTISSKSVSICNREYAVTSGISVQRAINNAF